MANLKVTFNGDQIGKQFQTAMRNQLIRVRASARGALTDVSRDALERAREDIRQSGNFGSRWTRGLKSEIVRDGEDYTLQFTHDIPYFMVHQRGALIRGRPLLYIPYTAEEAHLVKGSTPGRGGLAVVKQVRIPKRFHVIEIIRDSVKLLREFFHERMSRGN